VYYFQLKESEFLQVKNTSLPQLARSHLLDLDMKLVREASERLFAFTDLTLGVACSSHRSGPTLACFLFARLTRLTLLVTAHTVSESAGALPQLRHFVEDKIKGTVRQFEEIIEDHSTSSASSSNYRRQASDSSPFEATGQSDAWTRRVNGLLRLSLQNNNNNNSNTTKTSSIKELLFRERIAGEAITQMTWLRVSELVIDSCGQFDHLDRRLFERLPLLRKLSLTAQATASHD
jgi:hypothetical protein